MILRVELHAARLSEKWLTEATCVLSMSRERLAQAGQCSRQAESSPLEIVAERVLTERRLEMILTDGGTSQMPRDAHYSTERHVEMGCHMEVRLPDPFRVCFISSDQGL